MAYTPALSESTGASVSFEAPQQPSTTHTRESRNSNTSWTTPLLRISARRPGRKRGCGDRGGGEGGQGERRVDGWCFLLSETKRGRDEVGIVRGCGRRREGCCGGGLGVEESSIPCWA